VILLLRSATFCGDTIPIKPIGNTTLCLRRCPSVRRFARLPGIKFYFLRPDNCYFDVC
jgi:hypothetical protein